jgi:hypothetical protein
MCGLGVNTLNGFLGSPLLETALGLAFVYLLLAIFCTATVEWIAGALATRANTLRGAITQLLGSQMLAEEVSLTGAFYGHPLISALTKEELHSTWLSPRTFSTALLDLVLSPAGEVALPIDLCLGKLPDGQVKTALQALFRKGQADFSHLQTGLENWFDDAMHRASCRYRHQTRTWTLVLSVAVTVATNADTFQLMRSPGHLPGWQAASLEMNLSAWIARLIGWMLTVGAVSLGAPFWFDALNRFANFRNPGKPTQAAAEASHQRL